MLTNHFGEWAILAEKNEDKVYVNQDDCFTDLQILIKYSFLLNFLHESLMNLIRQFKKIHISLKVMSSPFYACAKQMFTSLFSNKCILWYLFQDCELFSLPFHYLYSKTFSEEIEERRRDISPQTRALA